MFLCIVLERVIIDLLYLLSCAEFIFPSTLPMSKLHNNVGMACILKDKKTKLKEVSEYILDHSKSLASI